MKTVKMIPRSGQKGGKGDQRLGLRKAPLSPSTTLEKSPWVGRGGGGVCCCGGLGWVVGLVVEGAFPEGAVIPGEIPSAQRRDDASISFPLWKNTSGDVERV